jgi:hypothetical protein
MVVATISIVSIAAVAGIIYAIVDKVNKSRAAAALTASSAQPGPGTPLTTILPPISAGAPLVTTSDDDGTLQSPYARMATMTAAATPRNTSYWQAIEAPTTRNRVARMPPQTHYGRS